MRHNSKSTCHIYAMEKRSANTKLTMCTINELRQRTKRSMLHLCFFRRFLHCKRRPKRTENYTPRWPTSRAWTIAGAHWWHTVTFSDSNLFLYNPRKFICSFRFGLLNISSCMAVAPVTRHQIFYRSLLQATKFCLIKAHVIHKEKIQSEIISYGAVWTWYTTSAAASFY